MIRSIEINGKTYYFVADDLGSPISFGYETAEQAESVAILIESSGGLATIPDGVDVEAAIDMTVQIIREVEVTNGVEIRTMVIERIDGKIMLWDRANDPNSDGLVGLAGDTDSDVQDALNDAGEWEVV